MFIIPAKVVVHDVPFQDDQNVFASAVSVSLLRLIHMAAPKRLLELVHSAATTRVVQPLQACTGLQRSQALRRFYLFGDLHQNCCLNPTGVGLL